MMKKSIVLILISAVCLSVLAGCNAQTATPSETAVSEVTTATPTAAPTPSPVPATFELTAKIDEQVLYDEGGIVVKAVLLEAKHTIIKETVLGSTEEETDPYVALNISVENRGDRCATVKAYAIAVNGITVKSYESATWVDTGDSIEDYFSLGTVNGFNLAGITDIAEIAFTLRIEDSDTWEIIALAPITISTSMSGSYTQDKAIAQGDVVCDENGIKIVTLGRDEEGLYSFLGPGFLLYVENNTDQPIWIDPRYDASFNGVDIGAADYETWGYLSNDYLMPGTCAYTSLTIEDRFLESMGIASIRDIGQIDCAFLIREMDSYDNILFETSMITMTFE